MKKSNGIKLDDGKTDYFMYDIDIEGGVMATDNKQTVMANMKKFYESAVFSPDQNARIVKIDENVIITIKPHPNEMIQFLINNKSTRKDVPKEIAPYLSQAFDILEGSTISNFINIMKSKK